MPDYGWVLPNLALGSAPTPANVPAMVAAGITDVLDLRAESESSAQYVGTGINYSRVPMVDNGGAQAVSLYQQGVQIIENALAQPGHKILVHCEAGQYRSPSMVYAYLRAIGYSATDAWNAVLAARPSANTQYVQYAEAAVPYLPTSANIPTGIDPVSASIAVGAVVLIGSSVYLFATMPKERSAS